MSTADQDEHLWTEDDAVETQPQPDGTTRHVQDENSTSVRRSSRLATHSPSNRSASNWPVEKILEALFRRGLHPPLGASHKELFSFLIEKVPDLDTATAAEGPAATPSAPRRATAKRKNCARAPEFPTAATAPAKRARTQQPSNPNKQNKDPVLATLHNIQSSLSQMDVRIQALEAPSSTSDPRSATYFQGNNRPDISPSAVDDVSYAPPPTVMAPRRTLATAVPAALAGVPFIPPAAAISPQLRAFILAGVPNPVSRRRTFQPAMPNLQPNGARLNASLQTYLASASHYMRSGLTKST
ncbi:uncharacterized protein LOC118222813 [Anguilla anguilla]|uniref:uncharacterized protein LOC118222813 n=1 Tax=Anguilla anguilla TaxID=7936 RepID=UPI0015AB0290|nr:uncharacterized protein LOC118222813 [Anguilla anguilla]